MYSELDIAVKRITYISKLINGATINYSSIKIKMYAPLSIRMYIIVCIYDKTHICDGKMYCPSVCSERRVPTLALAVEIRDVRGHNLALHIDRMLVLLRNGLVNPIRDILILRLGVGPRHVAFEDLGTSERAVQTLGTEIDVAAVSFVNAHGGALSI